MFRLQREKMFRLKIFACIFQSGRYGLARGSDGSATTCVCVLGCNSL